MPTPINQKSLKRDHEYTCNIQGRSWRFQTTWGLFSPKSLDEGTDMLIEHMPVRATDRCLDLGCGYGPIGLHMAAEAREGHADLIDKDFVAIDYSQRNAASHGLDNCRAFLSNGFSHIAPDARYDLIATNLPAKAGNELYYLYFYDALARMAPGARFYIVTISGLRKFIQRSFVEVFGNYQKLKQGSTYTVAMAELPPS